MRRLLDIVLSLTALVVLSPLLVVVALLIYAHDGHSPFFRARRVGRGGRPFIMLKFRSMVVGADRTGVTSTAANDSRITPIGHFVRRYKLDELTQLYNVLTGDMSLVGPRPNVETAVALYTDEERRLLEVRPGVTDLASIVFADEGEILRGRPDPDAEYDRLIRPWKSRLGLLYVRHESLMLYLRIILLTIVQMFSRPAALRGVTRVLEDLDAPPLLIDVCRRSTPLRAGCPPGSATARDTTLVSEFE